MIPKVAIKAYLNRRLEDHRWIKRLTKKELWSAVDALEPQPCLHEGLRKHQLACFLLGVAYPCFAFWLDLGSGKSLLTLELLNYWMQCGQIDRAVVVVKSDKAIPTWQKQIARWGFEFPHVVLTGTSEEKWQALRLFRQRGSGVIVVARPGLRAMLSAKPAAKRRGKKSSKSKWTVDRGAVADFMDGVQAMVLDESTDDAHHTSLNHKLAVEMRKHVDVCYALAGRPIGRDPTILWSQFNIVDGGASLGGTLGLFREAFFTSERNRYAKNKHVKDYTFQNRLMPKLNQMIQHRSIAYSSDECGGLPAYNRIVEEVAFSEEADAYYQKAVQRVIAAKGNLKEIKQVFLRMRQMSSGFIGFRDEQSGERAQVEFGENPKFDRLIELTQEVPHDTKMVIFYDFTFSGRKIVEALSADGLHPIWLWSGTKDSAAALRTFERDPRCRVAVVNNRVGAYSIDGLQEAASYGFFYESPVGAIDREQAERRLVRDGQKRKVFLYDLVVRGSVDAKILTYHKEGADMVAALLHNPEGVLHG